MHVYVTFSLLALSFALLLALLLVTCWRAVHRRDWRNHSVPVIVLLAGSGIAALAAFEMTTAFQELSGAPTFPNPIYVYYKGKITTITEARTTYYRAIRFELSDFLIGSALMLIAARMVFRAQQRP